ncbi:hypothetical protein KAR91_61790 [Candidatus Pacearchaeota archaeon]|nr:hypothetical protein [Candidatus Pacearchaeota archaeon]
MSKSKIQYKKTVYVCHRCANIVLRATSVDGIDSYVCIGCCFVWNDLKELKGKKDTYTYNGETAEFWYNKLERIKEVAQNKLDVLFGEMQELEHKLEEEEKKYKFGIWKAHNAAICREAALWKERALNNIHCHDGFSAKEWHEEYKKAHKARERAIKDRDEYKKLWLDSRKTWASYCDTMFSGLKVLDEII